MSWKTLRHALDLILDPKKNEIAIAFTGGEPLLEFPKMQHAIKYVEKHRPPGTLVRYSISTNGTLLTEEIASFLERWHVLTQLSFDGIAVAQDMRAPGTFRTIDKTLDRLKKKHPAFFETQLGIAVTVTSLNLPYLASSIDYLINKGARNISIAPSFTQEIPWNIKDIDELDAQFSLIFRRGIAHLKRTGNMPVTSFRNQGSGSRRVSKRSPMCGIGHGRGIAVDVDGEVYGCSLFAASYQSTESPPEWSVQHSVRMGPIDSRGLSGRYALFSTAIRKSRIFERKDMKYSNYRRCGDCEYFTDCFLCPVCILRIPGNNDPDRVSDFCCAFNRVSLKYRKRIPHT